MSEKRRTKRQSILVQQAKAGRITIASPHSVIEVAFSCQYEPIPGLANQHVVYKVHPGYGRIQHLMAITSDQKTYSFQGENATKDFLAKFSADYDLTNMDAVLRPSITWLGFDPEHLLDHLRLAMTPHFPYHAQHHLVEFRNYAVGAWIKSGTILYLFTQAIKNLYGYELPAQWEPGQSATDDLKLITEVLSRQKVWE